MSQLVQRPSQLAAEGLLAAAFSGKFPDWVVVNLGLEKTSQVLGEAAPTARRTDPQQPWHSGMGLEFVLWALSDVRELESGDSGQGDTPHSAIVFKFATHCWCKLFIKIHRWSRLIPLMTKFSHSYKNRHDHLLPGILQKVHRGARCHTSENNWLMPSAGGKGTNQAPLLLLHRSGLCEGEDGRP